MGGMPPKKSFHGKLAQAAPEAKTYEFQSGGVAWLVWESTIFAVTSAFFTWENGLGHGKHCRGNPPQLETWSFLGFFQVTNDHNFCGEDVVGRPLPQAPYGKMEYT